jgi:restriction system protein
MVAMWGIHNDALSNELLDHEFISIGWQETPDIRSIGMIESC